MSTTSTTPQEKKPLSVTLAPIIAGGIAGQASLLAVQPMDFLRTRLQTSKEFTGPLHCARQTLQTEGVRAFYRGMSWPFLAQGIYKAVMFGSFEYTTSYFKQRNTQNNGTPLLAPWQLALCGSLAGMMNSVIVTPVEMIRNNLIVNRQQQGANGGKFGVGDVMRQIYSQNGLQSFWKGQSATLLRDGLGVGAYFYGNNRMQHYLNQNTDLSPAMVQIFSGMAAGVCFWSVALPVDRIKSIIQTTVGGEKSSIGAIANKIVREEGISGLWKGFSVGAGRGIPAAAITFYTYSTVMGMINNKQKKD